MSQPVSKRDAEEVPPAVVCAADAGATEVTMVSVTAATIVPNTFFAVRAFIMISFAVGDSVALSGHVHCGHLHPPKTTEGGRE